MKRSKLQRGKRASSILDMGMGFIRIMFIIAAALSTVILVRMYIVDKIDTRHAEAAIIADRIFFSENTFAFYEEDIDRQFPGIIDVEQFQDAVLERALSGTKGRFAAKVTLKDKDGNIIKEAYANKQAYKAWYPLALYQKIGVGGPGGAQEFKQVHSVLWTGQLEDKPGARFETPIYNPPGHKIFRPSGDASVIYDKTEKKLVFGLKIKDPKKELEEIKGKLLYTTSKAILSGYPDAKSIAYQKPFKIPLNHQSNEYSKVVKISTREPKKDERIIIFLPPDKNNNMLGACLMKTDSKPNIYIYPESGTTKQVQVTLDVLGKVTTSVPPISPDNTWDVIVESDGTIQYTDSKGQISQKDYLFYEANILNVKAPEKGWIVKRDELESLFKRELPKMGLNDKEINDFNKYWIDRLQAYENYFVGFLEQQEIERIARLHIQPEPEQVIRVRAYFKPADAGSTAEPPTITGVTREPEKYHVVEWGGILDEKEQATACDFMTKKEIGTLEISVIIPNS